MSIITEMARLAAAHAERVMRNREAIVEAFIAETGLKPSECELVEETRSTSLGYQVVFYVRRRKAP